MSTLYFFTRFVYGNPMDYLDRSTIDRARQAEYVAALTGSKTLRPQDHRALEGLGFTLTQTVDPRTARAAVLV